MPAKPQSQPLEVTNFTNNSFTIKWDRWAGCTVNPDPIIYKLFLRSHNDNYWRIAKEGKGFYSYTSTDLKPDTEYHFFLRAYDESGQVCQYPIDNGCMTAKTLTADTQAPTVSNKTIKVTRITQTSIAIQWEPATDNVTAAKDIRYQVWFKPPSEPWRLVKDAKGITSHSFTGLKKGTTYAFYIKATDEAGNSLQYPLYNGSISAKTNAGDTQAPTAENRTITVL